MNDTRRDVWTEFGIASQPAWAFIDDDGTIEVYQGSLDESSLFGRIDSLLAS